MPPCHSSPIELIDLDISKLIAHYDVQPLVPLTNKSNAETHQIYVYKSSGIGTQNETLQALESLNEACTFFFPSLLLPVTN